MSMARVFLFKDDAKASWSHCVIAVIFIAYHEFLLSPSFEIIRLFLFHQVMSVMFLRQHLVSMIDRPRRPFGTRCVEHAAMMWSAVYSCAPHSQLQDETRLYLYNDGRKRPTPVCKWLGLTQAGPI